MRRSASIVRSIESLNLREADFWSKVPGNFIANQGTADIAITTRGSDWYWTVTAIMMISSLAFLGLSFTKPRTGRVFHYITAMITMVASVAYYSMASNLGWTPINVEFLRSDAVVRGTAREIFYVRYIDWVITTPLLLMDLLLTAGMPWPTIVFTILLDEIMIITGLAGALTYTSYKWGYWVFGMIALFYIAYTLVWESRKHAYTLGSDVGKVFLLTGAWTTFLWFLYPIAWGLSEGGNVIAPDSEAVFYGILDILAKPVFGTLLLWGHRNIEPSRLGLSIKDYAYGEGSHATHPSEKVAVDGAHTASTNGATNSHTPAATTTTAETV